MVTLFYNAVFGKHENPVRITDTGKSVRNGNRCHPDVIVRETSNLLDNSSLHKDSRIRRSCYGDGHASARIVEALKYINL